MGGAIIFSSCEEKHLQRDLAAYKAPFGYLHDSKQTRLEKKDSLYLIVKGISFTDSTRVIATNKIIVPLLVVNYFSTTMKVTLGKNSMMEPYTDFMYQSFLDEADRTAGFAVISEQDDSSTIFEITVDSCYTTSVFRKRNWSVLLTLGVSSETEQAEAALTHLYTTGRLKKNGVVLSEKKYAIISEPMYYLKRKVKTEEEMRSTLTNNLLESLSLGTKKCVEYMIADLNSLLGR